MPRRCEITGKIPVRGKSYAIRGIAKKKKGIGLKVTGIKRRSFKPNLLKKRFWFEEENRFISVKTSAHGIRIADRLGVSAIVRLLRKQGKKV